MAKCKCVNLIVFNIVEGDSRLNPETIMFLD